VRALRKLLTTIGRRERGATMVEYVLLVAVIAGISIVAVRALSASASEEVSTQSACVSQRPQPASCSAAAVDVTSTTAAPVSSSSTTTTAPSAATTTSTSTTTTAAPTTTTTAAPTTTTTTAAPAPAVGGFSGTDRSCTAYTKKGNCTTWMAWTTVKITRSGSPVANADVVVGLTGGGTTSCRTDDKGVCNLQVTGLNWNSTQSMTFTLKTVDGSAPKSTPSTKADRP
jgi:Flp pilus assembly pilin Flp